MGWGLPELQCRCDLWCWYLQVIPYRWSLFTHTPLHAFVSDTPRLGTKPYLMETRLVALMSLAWDSCKQSQYTFNFLFIFFVHKNQVPTCRSHTVFDAPRTQTYTHTHTHIHTYTHTHTYTRTHTYDARCVSWEPCGNCTHQFTHFVHTKLLTPLHVVFKAGNVHVKSRHSLRKDHTLGTFYGVFNVTNTGNSVNGPINFIQRMSILVKVSVWTVVVCAKDMTGRTYSNMIYLV